VRDPSSNDSGIVLQPPMTAQKSAAQEAADAGEHFCQMYDLAAARMGRPHPTLQLRLHAEQRSRSVESQLRATQGALAKAHESIVQMGLELDAERHAREDAEAISRSEQRASRDAMRLLEETVQPLRELRTVAAEHERQAEQQAQAYAQLQADRQAIETQLKATEASLAQAAELAQEARLQVETERRAREEAETRTQTQQHEKDAAESALLELQTSAAEERSQAEARARSYAELETKHQVVEGLLEQTQVSLERALELAEQMWQQVETERRGRLEAETKAHTEEHARQEAESTLLELQKTTEAYRVRAEEQAARADKQLRAHADFEVRRRAMDAQLKDMEVALAHAEYAAYRHAQRHAQIIEQLAKERRARELAEARMLAERRAREDAERALNKKNEPSAFWKKLLPEIR
jgi:hypothetical protein